MSNVAQVRHQQGIALHNSGDFAGALALFDAALTEAPNVAGIHYSRGNALAMLNQTVAAIAAYDACLLRDPGHVWAHYNRATALIRLQRWTEALAGLDRALLHNPAMPEAWNNRSGVLQQMGRHQEALDSIMQVLRVRPTDASALYNAGIMLLALNRFDDAVQAFERTLLVNPQHAEALGCLGTAALRSCDWNKLDQLKPHLFASIDEGTSVVPPLTLLAISDDPLLQKRCAEINTGRSLADTALADRTPKPLWDGVAYHHERIRIGYMSSDLRNHPVGGQIVGLLEGHDRRCFEIIGLFTGQSDGSVAHQRIVEACDQFHDIGSIGSEEAAHLIRKLEVDILVDLNGQTLGCCPAVLKYRPAPVNATYFGYAGTTGADFVDYIIGDPWVTPFELEAAMSEKIAQLPNSFWPVGPNPVEPEPVTRAQAGLPDGAFVFCCFNSRNKIGVQLFDSWMRLLKAVPGSVLWVRDESPASNARLLREADLRGVAQSRIIFAGRVESFARHLGRQRLADLFLDTFPYNAHVTASDALWAGLPVLTLQGKSFVSRVAASFLINLGLPELITTTLADYEATALALAQNPDRLADVRRRLETARSDSPLFDSRAFVSGIETAFRMMRDRAERGEPAQSFAVKAG